MTTKNKGLIKMIRIDPEFYASEVLRLRRIAMAVRRENRGSLRNNGCILCGTHRNNDHTCGL